MKQLLRWKDFVQTIVCGEQGLLSLEPLVEQTSSQLVGLEGPVGPRLKGKIEVHKELREREEAELNRVALNLPSRPVGNDIVDLTEIHRRRPALADLDLRQPDAEILLQSLLERKVGQHVFIPKPQIIGRCALIANKLDGQQKQRRLARYTGGLVLEPSQKTQREVQDVDTLLLLRRLRLASDLEQLLL